MAQNGNSGFRWNNRQTTDAPENAAETQFIARLIGDGPGSVSADGWCWWNAKNEKTGERVRVSGHMARSVPGELLQVDGRWEKRSRKGGDDYWSFKVEKYASALPINREGMVLWLKDNLTGVGETFAKALVDALGKPTVGDVITRLDERPELFGEIKTPTGRGLPAERLATVMREWEDKRGERQLGIFFRDNDISPRMIHKLYEAYGDQVLQVLEQDPYRISELRGIGFLKADEIARKLGTKLYDAKRVQAGLVYVLEKAEEQGNSYLRLSELFAKAADMLFNKGKNSLLTPSEADLCAAQAKVLYDNKKISIEREPVAEDAPEGTKGEQRVYRRRTWRLECKVAERLRWLAEQGAVHKLAPMGERPTEGAYVPTDEQWHAVEMAYTHRMSILTGLPGTGKCVHPDTRVLVDGRLMRAHDLWERYADETTQWSDGEGSWRMPAEAVQVNSLEASGQITPHPITALYRQHVSERLVRVTLADGSAMTITKRHQLLREDAGWTTDLSVRDRIAVPTQCLPHQQILPAQTRSSTTLTSAAVRYEQIVSIEEIDYSGYVYDFEVAGPHNYVAEGMLAHNTATTRQIIEGVSAAHRTVLLAAPTGKAAKRMTELTGHEAMTIHRLLKWMPQEGRFQHDATYPIEADLLIVDETSMLALDLANNLFQAIGPDTHVLLVGDVNQLPPIGAGKVLDDLIISGAVPTTSLTQIFRQAQSSMIIVNAHRINEREMPYLTHEEAERRTGRTMNKDFHWINSADAEDIARHCVQWATVRIPNISKGKLDPMRDIMILVPMNKGAAGLQAINQMMQARLNPKGRELGIRRLRVGDRVLQTVNDYESEIMNGELAVIQALEEASGEIVLSLDDGERTARIPKANLDSFILGYAMSIHKSQGSQFKAVVLPISYSYYNMLSRSLYYTAVTRAERLVIAIGEQRAMEAALKRDENRNSSLSERVQDPARSGSLF